MLFLETGLTFDTFGPFEVRTSLDPPSGESRKAEPEEKREEAQLYNPDVRASAMLVWKAGWVKELPSHPHPTESLPDTR